MLLNLYPTVTGIDITRLNIYNFYMPQLIIKCTDGRPDPNYGKASFLK